MVVAGARLVVNDWKGRLLPTYHPFRPSRASWRNNGAVMEVVGIVMLSSLVLYMFQQVGDL